ncbi:MAG: lysylphosphatidylglycerol synthase transmembrane domain-containing protein [Betaproteobacteria bacterium]
MTEERDFPNAVKDGEGPALWGRHTLLSVLITIAVLAFLASYVDLAQVWKKVAASDKRFLLVAALWHYGTYPVRGIRWRRSLNHVPHRCGNARFGLLVFFYNFVDNVVPAKLGDVYASHLAYINCGVRRSAALGSVVFLRMIDAWIVLILAASASWFLFEAAFPRPVAWALVIAFLIALATTAVIVAFVALKRAVPAWVPEAVRQRVGAFHTGMLPDRGEIIPLLLLTLVIWAMETMWLFFLARAFGMNLNAGEALFLTMIPIIVTAFPITPSGAGAVELTLFSCLRLVGVASPLAVSLTVVNRFIDFWLHIALGAFTWTFRRKIGLRTWRDRPLHSIADPDALTPPVRKENTV